MIYSYNGTSKKCPVPLVQTRLLLKKMCYGDICIVTINDKGSIQDIPKLLIKQKYQYSQSVDENGNVEITIQNKL
jgi:TusA-related sulfurtransferase